MVVSLATSVDGFPPRVAFVFLVSSVWGAGKKGNEMWELAVGVFQGSEGYALLTTVGVLRMGANSMSGWLLCRILKRCW